MCHRDHQELIRVKSTTTEFREETSQLMEISEVAAALKEETTAKCSSRTFLHQGLKSSMIVTIALIERTLWHLGLLQLRIRWDSRIHMVLMSLQRARRAIHSKATKDKRLKWATLPKTKSYSPLLPSETGRVFRQAIAWSSSKTRGSLRSKCTMSLLCSRIVMSHPARTNFKRTWLIHSAPRKQLSWIRHLEVVAWNKQQLVVDRCSSSSSLIITIMSLAVRPPRFNSLMRVHNLSSALHAKESLTPRLLRDIARSVLRSSKPKDKPLMLPSKGKPLIQTAKALSLIVWAVAVFLPITNPKFLGEAGVVPELVSGPEGQAQQLVKRKTRVLRLKRFQSGSYRVCSSDKQ